jgi:hypothetical protein
MTRSPHGPAQQIHGSTARSPQGAEKPAKTAVFAAVKIFTDSVEFSLSVGDLDTRSG